MAMTVRPQTPSQKISGGPNSRTICTMIGIEMTSTEIPATAPSALAASEAPTASPPRPCRAIG